jgi:hypothetical protein
MFELSINDSGEFLCLFVRPHAFVHYESRGQSHRRRPFISGRLLEFGTGANLKVP